uniref:hypothetical protein n=1 Tax=Candidatus Electronema sp. TaxID=2698783 RepID=UPI0040565D2D
MRSLSVFPVPFCRRLLLGCAAAHLLVSGCAPSVRQPAQLPPQSPPTALPQKKPGMSPQEQAEYQRQVLEPALATISGRIASYEQKLREWQELGGRKETLSLSPDEIELIVSCRNRVADLQDAYKNLQEQLLQERSPSASRELLFSSLSRFKENDISYLEGECPKLQADLSSMSGPRGSWTETAQAESGPLAAEPPAVMQEPQALEQDSASLLRQGQTLLKNGHEQEARSLFVSLLAAARREGDRQQEIRALQMLADLDFGFREYASARRKYSELRRLDSGSSVRCGRHIRALEAAGSRRDELDAYASLLLGCLTYNPDKDGFTVVQQAVEFIRVFPESPLAGDAEEWSQRMEQEAGQWFSGLLEAAERLEPAAALARLERVPLDILPLDKQDQLRQKKEQLRAAAPAAAAAAQAEAAVALPEQQAALASPLPDPAAILQETWDKGLAAMQAEDYDQAVVLFAQLRHTSYSGRAEGKMKEAEQLAGESVRKKAAALFQQAVSAADPEMKKTLLLSSKSLLEDILRKYPGAGIEAKIRKNISSVDRELAAIGSGQ